MLGGVYTTVGSFRAIQQYQNTKIVKTENQPAAAAAARQSEVRGPWIL